MSKRLPARIYLCIRPIFVALFLILSSLPAMADTVLVWLAEERAGVREVAPQSHPIIRELRAQVESPISVLIPLMDLTDQLFIDADILWRGDQEAILNASARYSSSRILVGRVIEGVRPVTEWILWTSGDRSTLTTQGDWSEQVNQLFAALNPTLGLDQLLGEPIQQRDAEPINLAPLPGIQGYHVTIFDLIMPTDFLDATSILREMFGQNSVRMISFNSGILQVSIDFEGSANALQRELAAHSRLAARSAEGRLEFTWN